jgi:choline dehydrogenase-like flavoprotein
MFFGGRKAEGGIMAQLNFPEFATHIQDEYDYIVVGSGAGGGPVAANLAKHGFTVLLLEAGGAEQPVDYSVPAFHPRATEQADLSWKFYIQHYEAPELQARDTINYLNGKIVDGKPRYGIFYPRAGTLGGCTAHYAMIFVAPHNSDWAHIQQITGDRSWAPRRMRRYFERIEACGYVDEPWTRWLNCAWHGYRGWLPTSISDPALLFRDSVLARLVIAALQTCMDNGVWGIKSWRSWLCGGVASFFRPSGWRGSLPLRLVHWLEDLLDPNDWDRVRRNLEGPAFVPLAVENGIRRGTRELICDTMQVRSDLLTVKLNALVTRVVLDDSNRATGVEFVDRAHLYRADPNARDDADLPPGRTVRARREVILSAGAFNTPQLLMLSGIGPREELDKHGIPTRVSLPGVGRNMQDRYEVGIVHKMEHPFELLKDAEFSENDREFREWRNGYGLYATNGAVISIIKRSSESSPEPDLFMFAVPGYFAGYRPCYSKKLPEKDWFTWVILKAHTKNTAGQVTLRSADPRDTPCINFRYFDEGTDKHGDDVDSVVAGIEFVRQMTARSASLFEEVIPGPQVQSRAGLTQFVKDHAWGHHACGTCRIGGADDDMAVLDSRFRVRGTSGLRVVDASIFPKIPGFFIVSAIYMIAEKASDVILEDADNAGTKK